MPSLDIIIPAFNAAHCLEKTLAAIADQEVSPGLSTGTIVVNNASTDKTADAIDRWAGNGVRRIDYMQEKSRSAARNAGVAASKADYVLLLDADCRLADHDCLNVVGEAVANNVDAGFGYTTGSSVNFWERYHRSLEAGRGSAGWRGLTTACCMVRREFFNSIGGFSTEYRHYGFEDRDFICRLKARAGTEALKPLPGLRAVHDDELTMRAVCEKMYVAGRYSAEVFRRNFPDEYRATGYAKVDADTAPRHMVAILKVLEPLEPLVHWIADRLSRWQHTPLAIGRPFVKLSSALSYFAGTMDRSKDR
jgi:glycosyltransferase involved in cell wall biosynthesis